VRRIWLGDMPAVLKGFSEQVLRPGFAISGSRAGHLPKELLAGRSARIVVTMGMPALFYRAHSVKSLKRNILARDF
jgi:putative NADPH-quinone reductase